jgi:nitrogen fixation protein NifU and related proteins
MDDFYREIIIEHYKNPAHRGEMPEKDFTFEDENPLCGDFIHVDLSLDENKRVKDAVFSGHGCAISLASADLLLESIRGKTLEEVKLLTKQNVLDLLGIELSPVRLKCALLPLKVVKAAVYKLTEADDKLVE